VDETNGGLRWVEVVKSSANEGYSGDGRNIHIHVYCLSQSTRKERLREQRYWRCSRRLTEWTMEYAIHTHFLGTSPQPADPILTSTGQSDQ
jgi:hypothetical protein